MKEQMLMYGVCAAISVAAVAVTSVVKLAACAIAKRAGKDISGNVKEYVFTPTALLLAAMGIYLWLEYGMRLHDEQLFILLVVCFSLATMLVYWLLFQPTRKLAVAIVHAVAKRMNAEPVVDAIEGIIGEAEDEAEQSSGLQSTATAAKGAAEKLLVGTGKAESCGKAASVPVAEAAADKLRAMVDAIKKK